MKSPILSFCLAVISCDFESLCLWTLSNHSDQSDWMVVSPHQPQSAQAGMVPVTDHSVGSSDGERLTERKLNKSFSILLMLPLSVKHIWSVGKS